MLKQFFQIDSVEQQEVSILNSKFPPKKTKPTYLQLRKDQSKGSNVGDQKLAYDYDFKTSNTVFQGRVFRIDQVKKLPTEYDFVMVPLLNKESPMYEYNVQMCHAMILKFHRVKVISAICGQSEDKSFYFDKINVIYDKIKFFYAILQQQSNNASKQLPSDGVSSNQITQH